MIRLTSACLQLQSCPVCISQLQVFSYLSYRPLSLPTPAGPPADNDTFWCPSYMSNCYSMYKTGLSFPAAQTACASQQGKMVSWNSYQEQVGTAAAMLLAFACCNTVCCLTPSNMPP